MGIQLEDDVLSRVEVVGSAIVLGPFATEMCFLKGSRAIWKQISLRGCRDRAEGYVDSDGRGCGGWAEGPYGNIGRSF